MRLALKHFVNLMLDLLGVGGLGGDRELIQNAAYSIRRCTARSAS
jgi:hypothetical protein